VPLSAILVVMLTASKSTWEDLVNLALRFYDLETESTPVDKKGQADASVLFFLLETTAGGAVQRQADEGEKRPKRPKMPSNSRRDMRTCSRNFKGSMTRPYAIRKKYSVCRPRKALFSGQERRILPPKKLGPPFTSL
jgi:hypothetical protein